MDNKFSLIHDTFESLIDTIKSHDNSVYFWIQGGAIRRVMDGNTKGTENWEWPVDIDIHCKTTSDYNKIKNVLVDKMNFKECETVNFNTFFEDSNIRIDLQNGGEMQKSDFFMLNDSLLWVDYTVSSVLLDSNYNLKYHSDFFKDIKSKKLKFVDRDYKYINELIVEHSNNNPLLLKALKIIIGNAIIITNYFYKFSNDGGSKPRYYKHSMDGYVMSKQNYVNNKLLIDNIKNDLSVYLQSFKNTGWWQYNHWYGIIQYHFGKYLRNRLFVKTPQKFEIVNNIFKKIQEKDNSIMEINLKGIK